MPANDQTVVLPHGIRPFWAQGPAAHFGLITFFVSNGQNPPWGREPYGSVLAILGGCSVWFVIFGGDVCRRSKKQVRFFLTSASFLGSSMMLVIHRVNLGEFILASQNGWEELLSELCAN